MKTVFVVDDGFTFPAVFTTLDAAKQYVMNSNPNAKCVIDKEFIEGKYYKYSSRYVTYHIYQCDLQS